MKKLICVFLTLILAFSVAACKANTQNENSGSDFGTSEKVESDATNNEITPDDSDSSQISDTQTLIEKDENNSKPDDDSGADEDDIVNPSDPKPQDSCAKGHDFSEKRVESTCTKKGSVTKTCSRCGKSETTELSLKAHSRKDSYKKLNATQHQKLSTCNMCGDIVTQNENHIFREWITTVYPTSKAEGVKTSDCKLCYQVVNQSIPKLETPFQEIQQRILELVNIEREKAELAPLQYYNAGQFAADIRAEEIIETFSHTRPDGTDCFTALEGIHYWTAGENIALGHRTPEQVMQAWMNSPGHKANILRDHYTHLIVGYDADAKAWVQLFLGFRS